MSLTTKTKTLLLAASVLSTVSGWAAIAITHSNNTRVVSSSIADPLPTDTMQVLEIEIAPANDATINADSPQHIRLILSSGDSSIVQTRADRLTPAFVAMSRSSR